MSEALSNSQKLNYQKTANQLYKEYKSSGGTLSFKNFIQREKDKGIFPINLELNEEIQKTIKEHQMGVRQTNIPKQEVKKEKKLLGLPTRTLVIGASIIVLAIVTYRIIQNRKK
jgi:hypothetical protein